MYSKRTRDEAPPEAQPGGKSAFQTALRHLAIRAYSVAELKEKLRRKAFDASAIEETVIRLKQLGYLDDRKLAERYASSLAQNRGWGRYRVERELKARRVDPRQVKPALDLAFEETNEQALLDKALEQKLRTLRRPLTRARVDALCASLKRRGFRSDAIIRAVRSCARLAPTAEEANLDSLED